MGLDNLWVRGEINLVEVKGLKDGLDGTFINTATINVTIQDKTGVSLTGTPFPITMDYTSGSDGDYTASVPREADASQLDCVVVHVEARIGNSVIKVFERTQHIIDD